ncbi:UDP-2,4-diacetamido-2,4,6-trideoxy-beta-L-altropyranose hydrolase [Paenibacillus sp. FSL R7-0337]|uniref:UDP-2,4-diacetamido-2,4, 6-trideoxy-beta-L-altropyranose hydrolase n=1 Tax=Paenibacillus sp. FSL R7-0337 TaxID=1926588 RepID=UPI00096F6CC6|nr:UDP-2,4-diacetamido-2,4,6-trideoxy-beta-L-altropyranose hydrolase [Paenibacillus sp. FSL R7-0337]OMF91054.1 UDP-2,4-diacetamido-2,4,6-trideoxy-beta-L-altropyranose hydrolase [Paenibacillus sp. FSL R7-0337]
MRFFFRVDGSAKVGTGHIVRCLALADELGKSMHEVVFICREIPDHFLKLIEKKKIFFIRHESKYLVGSIEDAHSLLEILNNKFDAIQEDFLIIDHYGIGYDWESVLIKKIDNIMVIDDLANRKHLCNILLDTNLYDDPEKKYKGLLPPRTKKFFGPTYALLREEFLELRNEMIDKGLYVHESINILVCFGGTDPTNETLKVISALELGIETDNEFNLTVILGQANPNIDIIKNKCSLFERVKLLIQPPSMALEMSKADIAVCGGGTMTWERYCMGLPAFVIAIADNQIGIAQQGEKRNIDRYLGESCFVTEQRIKEELAIFLKSPNNCGKKRESAMNLVDGKGVKRVVAILTDMNM